MTVPRHIHCSWGGTIYTDDIWQMGVDFGLQAMDTASDSAQAGLEEAHGVAFCEANVAALLGLANTWWTGTSYGNTEAKLSWAKMVYIVPDEAHAGMTGRYSDLHGLTPLAQQAPTGPAVYLTVALGAAPAQTAIAVSWKSDKGRGVGVNGRAYIPASIPPTTAHRPDIVGDARTDILAAWKTFMTGIAGLFVGHIDETGPVRHIISTGGSTKTGEHGSNQVVTSYRVGSLIDTQRRRRNKFRETYTSLPA